MAIHAFGTGDLRMKPVCFVRLCRETNLVVMHIQRLNKEGVVIP